MPSQALLSASYQIEISGWDLAENFFVEKTGLDWSEEHDRKVYLRHWLRDGAIVFVRLVHPVASGDSFPVPYQVESVGPVNADGLQAVSLTQLNPRAKLSGVGEHTPAAAREGKRR